MGGAVFLLGWLTRHVKATYKQTLAGVPRPTPLGGDVVISI